MWRIVVPDHCFLGVPVVWLLKLCRIIWWKQGTRLTACFNPETCGLYYRLIKKFFLCSREKGFIEPLKFGACAIGSVNGGGIKVTNNATFSKGQENRLTKWSWGSCKQQIISTQGEASMSSCLWTGFREDSMYTATTTAVVKKRWRCPLRCQLCGSLNDFAEQLSKTLLP